MDALLSSLNPEFPSTSELQDGDWVPMVRGGTPGPEVVFRLPLMRVGGTAIYKTTTESNASLIPHADAQLVGTIKSGRRYHLRAVLLVNASGSGMKFYLSGTATASWVRVFIHASTAAPTATVQCAGMWSDFGTTLTTQGNPSYVVIEGAIEPSADGTIGVYWASADVGIDASVFKGSTLVIDEV